MLSKWLVVLSAALLAFPAATFGAETGSGLTGPVYQAGPSEVNSLTVTQLTTGKFSFHDLGAGVIAGFGCTGAFAGAGADCTQADPGEVVVYLGDRDDNLTSYLGGVIGAHVDGGLGNDHLAGGYADDRLSGGAGNDITDGGPGDDVIDDAYTGLGAAIAGGGDDTQQGAQGNDTIVAGPGADTIDGGSQTDTVDYSAATAPLTVSVDAGSHDDGVAGEGDTVTNVERVLGGGGADTLAAGAASSTLAGGAGDDALRGGTGNDTLLGDDEAGHAGSGNDTLDGGAGADALRGGDGIDTAVYTSHTTPVLVTLDDHADDGTAGENDNVRSDVENVIGGASDDTLAGSATANALSGGPGNDRLTGAGGSDTLDGGAGDDSIAAADGGADAITCGAGDDAVTADAADAVAADSEHVDRPAAPAAPPAGSASPAPVPQGAPSAVLLAGGSLAVAKHGRVRITLGCPGQDAPCAGRVTLRSARQLASASFRAPAGAIRVLTLTLSKSGAKTVRRRHRVAATLIATNGTATRAVRVTLTA